MKVILRIFIPLCIFSFIAFGISVAVLGRDYSSSSEEVIEDVVISGDQRTYEVTESFTEIRANIGAYKMSIKPWSEDTAKIIVSGSDSSNLKASVSGGALKITTEWKWNGDWFRNLFSGNAFDTQVQVFVPDKTYDNLDLHVGAGALTSDGVRSDHVTLDVSAGKLNYIQPEGHRAEFMYFYVSAGDLIAKNAATSSYTVDVSAGSAEIYGLTGPGEVDVSAGSARLQFSEVDGGSDVSVSAGDVVLDIPEDASVKFNCDKSAGDIKIMAGGVNTSAKDGDKYSINGGTYTFGLDVSAGDIRVVNSTASAVEVTESDSAVIDSVVITSSFYESDIESPEEVTAVSEAAE